MYVGQTNCNLCPVAAVLVYMAMKGPKPGPLFTFSNKKPLTWARFIVEVNGALPEAGVISTPYSGHSFRSGPATATSEQGINAAPMKALGRRRSNTYQLYIKTSQEHFGHMLQALAGSKNRDCLQCCMHVSFSDSWLLCCCGIFLVVVVVVVPCIIQEVKGQARERRREVVHLGDCGQIVICCPAIGYKL